MAALNCAQAFHDDAVRERLAHPAEPTNLLILGLGGAGKKSLLANIRAAATLASPDALFATPSAPAPAADVDLFASPSGPAPTPAAAASPPNPRRLTVNNTHCAALTLGGKTARARAHNRRRLDKYLQGGLAPA